MPPEYTTPAPLPVDKHRELKIVLPILLLVIVGVGAYLYMKELHDGGVIADIDAGATTTPIVHPTPSNPTAPTTPSVPPKPTAIPAGFPTTVPVETATLTESYKVAYPTNGITQYSVSYTSVKSKDTLWMLYNSYFASNGYTIDPTSSSKAKGMLYGNKGMMSLSIIISSSNATSSLVQLNYIEKK